MGISSSTKLAGGGSGEPSAGKTRVVADAADRCWELELSSSKGVDSWPEEAPGPGVVSMPKEAPSVDPRPEVVPARGAGAASGEARTAALPQLYTNKALANSQDRKSVV